MSRLIKKYKWLIVGGLFLALSSLLIATSKTLLNILPSREVPLSHTAAYIPLIKDHLIMQEITLSKRYLNRVDLLLGNLPNTTPTVNIFLLLDQERRILWSKRFSSTEINGPTYYPFEFPSMVKTGKGSKVYAAIYSPDSDAQNFLVLLRNPDAGLGPLTDLPILRNDIPLTLEQQPNPTLLPGSMGVKVYETGTRIAGWFQVILYLLALTISLLIVFHTRIKPLLLRIQLKPHRLFLFIGLFFGLIFAFVTPPFQVADETSHLFRTWQISEFNLLNFNDDVPQSLIDLGAMADRMKFMAHEKTSVKELLSLMDVHPDETHLTTLETPNYVLPYLPQAIGLSLGAWLGTGLLGQFYIARILNLLVSVLILFLAIRTTPVMKWLFFLLSLLPMVLYQEASLSYDAMTISLSFLLFATLLKLAYDSPEKITIRDLVSLFITAGLLALCKPPYYIIAFAFLIIPMHKFASRKRYWFTFLALAATIVVCSQFWSVTREVFRPKELVSGLDAPKSPTGDFLHFVSTPKSPTGDLLPPQEGRVGEGLPGYSASSQQDYILEDLVRYIGILGETIGEYGHLYLISFIGLFGWVDTPLPWFLVMLYYIMLLLATISLPSPGIRISWREKTLFLAIFILGFILIETAMYLCCNPVGATRIMAVQGRYFTAFGPLVFALFYSRRFLRLRPGASSRWQEKSGKSKRNKKREPDVQPSENRLVFLHLVPWIVTVFASGGLICSLYVILTRFYIITL